MALETPDLGQMFEPVDETELPPVEAPVKRGPGRPKGSTNKNSTDRAPRRNTKTWIKAQVASLVGLVNIGLVSYPATRDDALDEREMDLLTEALTAEAMSSERVMQWMKRAAAISPHFMLIQACVAIALPRLQRRNIIPNLGISLHGDLSKDDVAEMMRQYNGATGDANTPDSSPFSMETGRAFDDFGRDGFRENYPS